MHKVLGLALGDFIEEFIPSPPVIVEPPIPDDPVFFKDFDFFPSARITAS